MRKILIIGGTGTISSAVVKKAVEDGEEVFLLNRGNRISIFNDKRINHFNCDINDTDTVNSLLGDTIFDVVADFISFVPEHLERNFFLFKKRTKQYIFISSASAYQKPLGHYLITEGTPLSNPYWEYSRNKILCEEYLINKYRAEGFPVTIVRPSHTYDERSIPLGVHGKNGSWQVANRMFEGKPVIIHGDGTSLWTMTHNSDFAMGFNGLFGNIHAIGEAVHITSDETVTWNQVYESIAAALGVELKAVHVASEFLALSGDYDLTGSLIGDKANSVVFDNSKIKRLVPGFCAKTRFDTGIKQTIENVLSNKELRIEDPEFDRWCDHLISLYLKASADVRALA
ncbi:MAG TPA: SDR family oxidoreductase [Spirochaetota bacterium]|nr:SDR family oxidoreductase [Spirochaetota bacterium]